MKINIKVKTNARQNSVKQLENNIFEVRVSTAPEKGKANEKVIELLAEYFKIPKSNITILSGFTNRNKILNIFE